MFFQSTAIVILLVFYGCYYMKLKIAFLQLLPGAAIEDNIEKGIKACRGQGGGCGYRAVS